ncbi:hypothetical protein Q8A67_023755 [Cirrhinus molitorella]|uniref:Uncharacterized protein n=1 Tax=Cirrhinus molitorella TaxID=172907 RepID=A0AA88P6N0_9TELE|nr:hypothetical protein Q8A67_023755 [Cirrhinus molitorella]
MEGTSTDGGVTGAGRLCGPFLKEFKLRNYSSLAHTPEKIGFQLISQLASSCDSSFIPAVGWIMTSLMHQQPVEECHWYQFVKSFSLIELREMNSWESQSSWRRGKRRKKKGRKRGEKEEVKEEEKRKAQIESVEKCSDLC